MKKPNLVTLTILASSCLFTVAAYAGIDGDAGGDMPHRMMTLVVQLGVILLAARLGNILFRRLRLPGVAGELAAGILIGPYVLGAVPLRFLGFPNGLFHVSADIMLAGIPVSPELYGICAVASVLLLFMVGLETDISLFMRYSVVGSLVGLGGVTVSFVFGDLAAVGFYRIFLGQTAGFLSAPCLFLGIITTATSVGITARLLSEQRKLDSPEGVTILAGAVFDDVLGIILLAIGMGVIAASRKPGDIDWGHIAIIAVKAVGIWIAATAIGLVASRRISTLLKWFKDRSAIAVMATGLALVLAGLFEEAGLAMIVGAYVMGLSLSRSDINLVVREKIHPVSSFLVPVFFTVMGMLVNIRLLLAPEVLLFGVIYTLVAAFAKIVGCGIPALACNFNAKGALRIGAGMLPRGEVTLIIAGVGLAAGLLDQKLFGVVIFMTLAASLTSPGIITWLFKLSGSGLKNPEEEETGAAVAFSFPSVETAELLVQKLMRVFESEGFFVHTIHRRDRIYQLRKDEVVIGFEQSGSDILFDCGKPDVPLVNAAMYEVLADLEHTINELRKPIDRAAIVRKLQDEAPGKPGQIAAASSYVVRDTMLPQLKGKTKEAVIDELLGAIKGKGLIKNLEAARDAVMTREASMSTGMQYGIAIPHGRTDAVDHLVCSVGLKPDGVDFDSIDGEPSRIFVLTLSPLSAAAPHVQFMSTMSQILNESGRDALLCCNTADQMYDILSGKRDAKGAPGKPRKEKKKRTRTHGKPRTELEPGLSKYLKSELLEVNLPGETKEEVINALVDILARHGGLKNVDTVRRLIFEREKQMSTGMEKGVAIPHARTDEVSHLTCVVGLKKDGIDFEAIDGQPSNIFVLTLSPTQASEPHIQFMAMISRILDEEGRDRVLAAETPEELWYALAGGGAG
ncbi:MAG: PTS sugar transporter subunit IIA [Kiritimatiellia bacterium]|jgi:Kef-type K+ transport system membrane component KefB/mannitol/fructose-specific phosphotransferase system IIA component (Ntr-type)|nr:PTS sugar transporter subunit IIA [Kiritimatiellia bacterium]